MVDIETTQFVLLSEKMTETQKKLDNIRDKLAVSYQLDNLTDALSCVEQNKAFKAGFNVAMERAQVLVDELRSTIARFDAIKHTTLCIGGDQLHIDFNCKHCLARYGGDKAKSALQKFYGEENDK